MVYKYLSVQMVCPSSSMKQAIMFENVNKNILLGII